MHVYCLNLEIRFHEKKKHVPIFCKLKNPIHILTIVLKILLNSFLFML